MTYLEEYYKRLSEQLNERYINLQKLSLLLETPGIEDVKKHFGTMRDDQFEEYMMYSRIPSNILTTDTIFVFIKRR